MGTSLSEWEYCVHCPFQDKEMYATAVGATGAKPSGAVQWEMSIKPLQREHSRQKLCAKAVHIAPDAKIVVFTHKNIHLAAQWKKGECEFKEIEGE